MNSELVGSMRNTESMMSKCLLKCLTFCLLPHLTRIAECLEITVLARIAECLEIKIVQLSRGFHCQSNLPFCVDDEKENPANLSVTYYRNPTEKVTTREVFNFVLSKAKRQPTCSSKSSTGLRNCFYLKHIHFHTTTKFQQEVYYDNDYSNTKTTNETYDNTETKQRTV